MKVKVRRCQKDPGKAKGMINFMADPFGFVRVRAQKSQEKMRRIR